MKGRLPLGKRCDAGYTRGISGGTTPRFRKTRNGSHQHTRPTRAYSPTSWHNCPSLSLTGRVHEQYFSPSSTVIVAADVARLAGIRTRIQGSARCPRYQPQVRRFVSFLTYTKLPRIVCTQPAMLSNVSKYTNFHSQPFWIIFTYTHVLQIGHILRSTHCITSFTIQTLISPIVFLKI